MIFLADQAGQIGSNAEIVSAKLELDVDNPGNSSRILPHGSGLV